MEHCVGLFQAAQRDPHCCEGASEHQVDAAAAVHEDATHIEPSDLRLKHQGSMTWARDLAGVIRTTECDAGLRTAEVLRDGGWSGHSQANLVGDLLLHPVCWAHLLDHQ